MALLAAVVHWASPAPRQLLKVRELIGRRKECCVSGRGLDRGLDGRLPSCSCSADLPGLKQVFRTSGSLAPPFLLTRWAEISKSLKDWGWDTHLKFLVRLIHSERGYGSNVYIEGIAVRTPDLQPHLPG